MDKAETCLFVCSDLFTQYGKHARINGGKVNLWKAIFWKKSLIQSHIRSGWVKRYTFVNQVVGVWRPLWAGFGQVTYLQTMRIFDTLENSLWKSRLQSGHIPWLCFAHNLLYSIHLVYKCTRELKPCNMVQKTQFILHCMLFTFFEALQKSPSCAFVNDESGVGAGISGRRRRR